MSEIPISEEEAAGFEQGCRLTLIALHLIGVDLKADELVKFLAGIVNGDLTLLPSPEEIKTKDQGGNLNVDDAAAFYEMASTQRRQWSELWRQNAAILLKIALTLK